MILLYFILLIPFQLLNATSREVDCEYSNNHYDVLGSIYQCKVVGDLTITLKDQSTITSASQDHSGSKSNDDVFGFVSDNKFIKYFPKGLEKVFKNLQLFHIRFTFIQELHQSDMKPFPELKEIDLHDNDIKVLEDGLFDFNPNLVFVSFSNNKITHIGLMVFNGLNNLKYLYLTSNTCTSRGAYLSRSEVLEVVEYAKIECLSSEYKEMDEKLNELENEVAFLEPEELEEKIENFEVEFNSSSFSESAALNEKLKNLKITKADEIRLVAPLFPNLRKNEGKTFQIILILVIVLSVVIIGGVVWLFIKKR
ncbi:hypothetical protein ACKWTF_010586 [Chironomus riparius]